MRDAHKNKTDNQQTHTHVTRRLPIASTCFNILKLPPYNDMAVLKEKLIKAIMETKGFNLT